MSQILATRDLCARALEDGQPNPWQLARSASGGHDASEQDFAFFAPLPAPGETVFTRSRSESGGGDGSLLTQIFDNSGRLLAEGWTNTAAAVHANQNTPATVQDLTADSVDEVRGADLLAAHLAATYGPDSLRRFRVRIAAPVGATDETTCSARELQRYTRDRVQVVDLALTCALADGAVVARAWATCAV